MLTIYKLYWDNPKDKSTTPKFYLYDTKDQSFEAVDKEMQEKGYVEYQFSCELAKSIVKDFMIRMDALSVVAPDTAISLQTSENLLGGRCFQTNFVDEEDKRVVFDVKTNGIMDFSGDKAKYEPYIKQALSFELTRYI